MQQEDQSQFKDAGWRFLRSELTLNGNEVREWEGNEKSLFHNFGNGKARERESEAIVPGNSREREV